MTAIKFLIDEISCRFVISEEIRIAMYKAIEMEKQQIINAVEWNYKSNMGEVYYNATYSELPTEPTKTITNHIPMGGCI